MRIDRKRDQTTIFGWRSSKAPLGFRDNPSHSQWISLSVTFCSSSGVSGQWKESRSSRFIRIQNPDPSHWRILINVRLRLQNANIQRGVRVEMEFQFDDCSQTSVALAQIGNPARQIDRCASEKSSISLQSLQKRSHQPGRAVCPNFNPDIFRKKDCYGGAPRRGIERQLLFRRQLCKHRSSNTFRFRNLWLDFSDPIAQGRLGDRILLTPVLAG